jgi:tetratricopeptide (TPR) repeat protein
VALALAQRGPAAERCPLDLEATRALWSPAAAQAIGKAFAATGRSYAADTAARVAEVLAQRASAWGAMHQASCEATWVKGSQSEALLDLRTACLGERRLEQVSLVALLSRPAIDAATVDRAVQAATGLPAITDCADADALRSRRAPPPPGAADQVAALRDRLAELKVRTLAGDYGTAVADGRALVEAARAIDYTPLVAEASYEYALAASGVGEFEVAQTAFEQAMEAAGAATDDHTAALAAAQWLWVVGYAFERADEALLSGPMARTLAARVPGDVTVQGALHNSLGAALWARGDYAGAQVEYGRALDQVTRAWGAAHPKAAVLLNDIGGVAQSAGDHEHALIALTQAVELHRRSLGPEHPYVGQTLTSLGMSQQGVGWYKESLDTCREALRILEGANGPEHVTVALALTCFTAAWPPSAAVGRRSGCSSARSRWPASASSRACPAPRRPWRGRSGAPTACARGPSPTRPSPRSRRPAGDRSTTSWSPGSPRGDGRVPIGDARFVAAARPPGCVCQRPSGERS